MNVPHQPQSPIQTHSGSCHCGAVRFEVSTALEPATRCNCSLCRRRGALMSPAFDVSALRIIDGADALAMYQFNTRVARHFFCKVCGVYPLHQTRKDPQIWRVNLGCLDGVDSYALENTLADGASLSVVEDA
ncbi:Glutathione-dependent formaldehyde-activating enzyme [compost metagenome]